MPGATLLAGRGMLAPVHYDDHVPSPPFLLKARHLRGEDGAVPTFVAYRTLA